MSAATASQSNRRRRAPAPRSRHMASGSRGEVAACARKVGERWGRRRLVLDRAEIEQGEGGVGLVCHAEGKGRGGLAARVPK
jgi:hypothetical protein